MPPDGTTSYSILCGKNEATEEKASSPTPGGAEQPLAPNTTVYSKQCGEKSGSEELGSGSNLSVRDEGTQVLANAFYMDFTGASVTASSPDGIGVTVDLSNVGGSPLEIFDEGSSLTQQAVSINFVGPYVTATAAGDAVTATFNPPDTTGELTDVTLGILVDGQVLRHNGAQWVNAYLGLLDLGDVENTAPDDGDILKWNAVGGVWQAVSETGGALPELDDLTNVDVSGSVVGQFLKKVTGTGSGEWSNVWLQLSDNLDVDNSMSPSEQDVLSFIGGQWTSRNLGSLVINLKLDELTDVDTTGVQDGYGLYYDSSDQTWKDGDPKTSHNHDDQYAPIGHNHDADYVNVTGDTMTGPLNVVHPPTVNEHASSKLYVDTEIADAIAEQVMGDHADVDTTTQTPDIDQSRNLLEWNGSAWVPGDGDRVRWLDAWTSKTYYQNDMVRDGIWTMIANKITTDKPAPVGDDNAQWVTDFYGGFVPQNLTKTDETVWVTGNRFTYPSGGYVHGYRFYIPENSGNFTYEGWVSEGSEGNLVTRQIFASLVPTSVGWITFPETRQLTAPGTTFDVFMGCRAVAQPSSFASIWDIKNTGGDPGEGEANFQGNATEIRVSNTDDGDVNQYANLQTIQEGATISFSGLSWTVTSITTGGGTGGGGWHTFFLSPNQGRPGEAKTTISWEWGATDPIPYVQDVDLWPDGDPNVFGFEGPSYDPLNPPDADNDAFGADIMFELLTISDDWDIVALSGGSSGGGGGGDVTSVFGRTGAVVAAEGDYSLDLLGDVDTTSALPQPGDVLAFDGAEWTPSAAAGGIVRPRKAVFLEPFDGSRTSFTIGLLDFSSPNIESPLQLVLSIAGVILDPGVDYQSFGDSVTLTEAPQTTDEYFIIFYDGYVVVPTIDRFFLLENGDNLQFEEETGDDLMLLEYFTGGTDVVDVLLIQEGDRLLLQSGVSDGLLFQNNQG